MSENKIKDRSKKSIKSISECVFKEGFASLVPGGGLIYDIGKRFLEHGREYYSDRTERRLEEFHEFIINGNVDLENIEDFLSKDLDLNDYSAVISSCIQDIEEEKTRIYSQLMYSLIKEDFDCSTRRHFIISSKNISYEESIFLKELYINSKYDLMVVGGAKQQFANLLKIHQDPIKKIKINKLDSCGFIDFDNNKLTAIGEHFTESIFSKEEIIPEAIGKKEYSGQKFLIISYHLSDSRHELSALGIQEALKEYQRKSSIQVIQKEDSLNVLGYRGAFLLIGEDGLKKEYINIVKAFSQKRLVTRVNLGANAEKVSIPEINFIDSILFESNEKSNIKKQMLDYLSQIWA